MDKQTTLLGIVSVSLFLCGKGHKMCLTNCFLEKKSLSLPTHEKEATLRK